ncbi:MAG: AI-2E family transporter [Bacteroidota bacterium]
MKAYRFGIQKLTYVLVVLCILIYGLIIGKSILAPLAFAILFAFMLKPLCGKIEKYLHYRPLAIFLSFVIALLPIVLLVTFFSMQLVDVVQNMDSITKKIQVGFSSFLTTLNNYLGISIKDTEAMINENKSEIVQTPLSYLGVTLSVSGALLVNTFLTFIYTFLILLYRNTFKQFYLIQFGDSTRENAAKVIQRIESVVQKYLYGLLVVILILGVLNTAGLTAIGIKYATFWGFLAAFLAIIPYVGTTLGGLLPFLYAIASTDNYWQPVSVIVLFGFIQVLEGNLITPKVVGSSIKLNPLAAILSLIVGGSIWGMAGLILALPLMAIIRIIFQQIDFLKPVSVLLSDEVYDKESLLEEKFDKEKFRIFNYFKRKRTV